MAPTPIRLLLIDDAPDYLGVARGLLRGAEPDRYVIDFVSTYQEGLAALLGERHDVCLLDYYLGEDERHGLELLRDARARGVETPVILISGVAGHDVGLEAAAAGASDFLLKATLDADTLERSIRYALSHAATLRTLRESERRFRLLAENATDLITQYGTDGTCTYASPSSRTLLGYEPAELVGRAFMDLVHLDDLEIAWRAYQALLAEDAPQVATYRMLRKDGSSVWAETSSRAIRDPRTRQVVEIQSSSRDVTASHVSEEELRRTLSLLRATLESSKDGIAVADLEGRITSCNGQYAQLFGLVPEEVMGADHPTLAARKPIAEEAREAFLARLAALYADPRAEGFDVVHLTDGRVLEQRSFPQWLDGRIVGRIFVWSDVTARVRSEEMFRLLSSAVQQAQEGVVLAAVGGPDEAPAIVFVNGALERMTGWTQADLLGGSLWLLLDVPRQRASLDELRTRLAQGHSAARELEVRRLDGSTIWVDWRAAPIRDAAGRVTHVVAMHRDVTEQRQFHLHLQQSAKMEAVGRLAGGVAHDFNNLLTAIMGYAELVLAGLPEGHELSADATEIRKAAQRAAGLTRQLLAFSRRQVLQPKVLNLNTVVADMVRMLQRLIGEDIELLLKPGKGLGRVKADPSQLEQVILNLALNARDAMPEGGRLILETANVDLTAEYAAEHVAVTPGPYVMLSVTDTGTGMDRETLAHIFEPFFTTKAPGKGTGLGLATVYGIVKQSGGNVWVYSEPRQGTCFKIYLPRADAAADPEAAGGHAELPGGRETVLLAEDEPSVRALAQRVLERQGYRVLAAQDMADALGLAEHEPAPVALLLTDVVMPAGTGPRLADRLRERWPDLRVLFMSGYTETGLLAQQLVEPGNWFLQKPFLPDVLVRRVREVLDSPLPATR